MSDDEKLKEALSAAHRGEHPPDFRALVERPRRRPRFWAVPLVLAAATAVALLVWTRGGPGAAAPGPVELASLKVDYPLDFLLDVKTDPILNTTPRFDGKGAW
jgi:hypothetical protein